MAAAADPRLLTVPQAARRWPELGTQATWYRREKAGELPTGAIVRLGGRRYVRVRIVEAWLEGAALAGVAPEASALPQTDTGKGGRLRVV